jgi:type VI secretion system secreted protein Hcp
MRLLQNVLFGMFFVFTSMSAFISSFAVAEIIDTKVVIDHSNFTLVSSRRVTRTVSEYTIRAVAKNLTAIEIKNVTAKIISTPSNITIVDGNVNFGVLAANASAASSDEFTIKIDLRQAYSLADLKWEINGEPAPPTSGPAAVGIFMSIDKNAIKGDVNNRSHKDWIEVLAWSEGSSNSGTTHQNSGGTVGKFNLGDVSVMKYLDSASLDLRMAIAAGRYIEELKIDVIKDCGGNKYTQYAITLNQVLVSSLSNGASGGQDRLVENVTFNTASIETMYTPVGKDCRFENPIYSLVSYN